MFDSTHNTDDEENESDATEDTDQSLSLKDDCDDVEISVVDDNSEENDSKLAVKRAASSSSSPKKRRRTSVYETAAITAADGMAILGANIKDSQLLPSQTRFDQCVSILNEMQVEQSISSEDYFRISERLMEKEFGEQHCAFFAGMSAELRMQWLTKKGLLDISAN